MVLALLNLKYLWNMLSDQRSELQMKVNECNKTNSTIKALQLTIASEKTVREINIANNCKIW